MTCRFGKDFGNNLLAWISPSIYEYHVGITNSIMMELELELLLPSISFYSIISRGPHLILVPLSTLGNWLNELQRFCPSIRPLRLHGTKEEREELLKEVRKKDRTWDVVVTTYEMAIIEKGTLSRVKWE